MKFHKKEDEFSFLKRVCLRIEQNLQNRLSLCIKTFFIYLTDYVLK